MSSSPNLPSTSGLAIASLALSVLSIVLGPFGFIPGIICGHIARSECARNPSVTGSGIALAGLIIGYGFLVLMILLVVVLVTLIVFGGTARSPYIYPIF